MLRAALKSFGRVFGAGVRQGEFASKVTVSPHVGTSQRTIRHIASDSALGPSAMLFLQDRAPWAGPPFSGILGRSGTVRPRITQNPASCGQSGIL